MKKLSNYLAGYKTKIIAFCMAVINILQVFDITQMTEAQIGAINALLTLGLALAIRDTVVRTTK